MFRVESKDPYKVLGISQFSDQDEIRKAYKELALKYHPDRHPIEFKDENTARFQEISEAYENLSNMSRQKGNINFNDIFKGMFSELFNKSQKNKINNLCIYRELEVSLENIYNGKSDFITYERQVPKTEDFCTNCNGSGKIMKFVKTDTLQNEVSICEPCNGKGKIEEFVLQSCTVNINIQPGFSRKSLFFTKKGHVDFYGNSGDLIINIIYKPHKMFTRKENDLHCDANISFKESMLGTSHNLTFLNGEIKEIPIDGPVKSGTILKIKKLGINPEGSLFVKIKVTPFPTKLTKQQRNLIEKYF